MVWILIYRDIVHTNILDICIYHLLTKHNIDVCIIIHIQSYLNNRNYIYEEIIIQVTHLGYYIAEIFQY